MSLRISNKILQYHFLKKTSHCKHNLNHGVMYTYRARWGAKWNNTVYIKLHHLFMFSSFILLLAAFKILWWFSLVYFCFKNYRFWNILQQKYSNCTWIVFWLNYLLRILPKNRYLHDLNFIDTSILFYIVYCDLWKGISIVLRNQCTAT